MSQAFSRLSGKIRDADAVTAELLTEVIREICSRLPSVQRTKDFQRLEQYIQLGAWTDAVLALLALELPQWQVRRIVYDAGEWHCALSCQRELPDWIDQSVECCHPDLSLAILSALVDVQRVGTFPTETASAPTFPRAEPLYMPFCCDNFA
jgi:hypothetical protein